MTSVENRVTIRHYRRLLTEFWPTKPVGAFITADFLDGCNFRCPFCITRRNEARELLIDQGLTIDNRVSPEKMHAWHQQMPSIRAGVQIRIGHDTDAGLESVKGRRLIELTDPKHSITYLTRRPLFPDEVDFFTQYRDNLLLKFTATPRSASLGITANPMKLIQSAGTLDPRMVYWVIGPLVADNQREAFDILEALPPGSTLFLKTLNYSELPRVANVPPHLGAGYAELEAFALRQGHILTEWFCRSGLARVGQGFFDIDKITQQPDSEKKERELALCQDCTSQPICHQELDMDNFNRQLTEQLDYLQLKLLRPPERTGPRSFLITVNQPSSRGDETYLNHVIKPPVSIVINTRERGRSQGGSFGNVEPAVLKRWYKIGFFPTTELNVVARRVMADIVRIAGNDVWKGIDYWAGEGPEGGSKC